jgi:hypothetical protein
MTRLTTAKVMCMRYDTAEPVPGSLCKIAQR